MGSDRADSGIGRGVFLIVVLFLQAVSALGGTEKPIAASQLVTDPVAYVNPLIGTANGGNTFPGAMTPFGMVQFSPENTRGDHTRAAAPGGYHFDAAKIRGFALTHLSGTGCRGASGDIPFMPIVGPVTSSPSADATDSRYASTFDHVNEQASPGYYQVSLDNGVKVELTASPRTGYARFTYLAGQGATLLIRTSDCEVGSSDANIVVDPTTRTVSGSVTSGNFCGYLAAIGQRSYYKLYFVAHLDQAITGTGTWRDDVVTPGSTTTSGGTSWDAKGFPGAGKGSGAFISLDTSTHPVVNMRVGISYVSLANAEANLKAENDRGTTFDIIKRGAQKAWNEALGRIQIGGGDKTERTIFYTALYHSLMHPNIFSDVNGQYWGFDQRAHTVSGRQNAQYANFSGWDVYRSQLQLVTLMFPKIASDIAQSLLNQANQNEGEWDRWTHNSGGTRVMNGDPSAPAVAGIYAFGGREFDVKSAFDSLLQAATVPTAHDLSNAGCPVECVGQRPSLDSWLKIHYLPTVSNSWGSAAETLEDGAADFSLACLAQRLGDSPTYRLFLERSGYWKNLFNPNAHASGGFIQNRNADGSWPAFDPTSDDGFVEGSAAQYLWMVPFDARGLFDLLGGNEKAEARLDGFFRKVDGSWALTKSGELHAEMDNEPSVATPWLYSFLGKPAKTQEIIREVLRSLWRDASGGIPGNDDLGQMSSWYVWSAMGMYPLYPGRAELVLTSPLFEKITIKRDTNPITIVAGGAGEASYIKGLKINGQASTKSWLAESFIERGGRIEFILSRTREGRWGSSPRDVPPSYPATRR